MGTKFNDVGGGPAVGLGNDWTSWLGGMLGYAPMTSTGSGPADRSLRYMQSDPMTQTGGITGILHEILGSGAGALGGSLAQLLQQQSTHDIANLRARYGASGGTSFGTPAAYAESLYRSEAVPRTATAVGNLQLGAILPLLQLISGTANKGISQRQTVAQPSDLASAAGLILPAAATFLGGPAGAALFGGGGGTLTAAPPTDWLRSISIPNYNTPGPVDLSGLQLFQGMGGY